MFNKRISRRRGLLRDLLLSAAILAVVLSLFLCAVSVLERRTEENRLQALTEAVRRSCVQCYAIEGRYPPSIEYLEKNYGIVIDRSRYYVFYDGWAGNIMPDITILPNSDAEGSGKGGR